MKVINNSWSKPGDEIPQANSISGHLRPPKLTDEQARLVADIKRHHPNATTEQILADLKAWGVE